MICSHARSWPCMRTMFRVRESRVRVHVPVVINQPCHLSIAYYSRLHYSSSHGLWKKYF